MTAASGVRRSCETCATSSRRAWSWLLSASSWATIRAAIRSKPWPRRAISSSPPTSTAPSGIGALKPPASKRSIAPARRRRRRVSRWNSNSPASRPKPRLPATARIVTEQWKRCTGEEGVDRREVDRVALDLVRVGRERQDATVEIEQVDLDARVDLHVGAERGLERLHRQPPLGDQVAVGDDAPRDVAVEVLRQRLQVAAGRGGDQQGVEQADRHQQRAEHGGEAGVEGAEHAAQPVGDSANL